MTWIGFAAAVLSVLAAFVSGWGFGVWMESLHSRKVLSELHTKVKSLQMTLHGDQ